MAPKLFFTGATGYIGGDALYAIATAHPDWQITCLVRDSDKGAKIAAQFASVRLVYGDLDSGELIEREAGEADIILHCAHADHVPSANAFVASLLTRKKPLYFIHTSGTGILTYPDVETNSFGNASSKIWDDVADIEAITSLPDHAAHRNVDKIILEAPNKARPDLLHVSIVCPPTIYGTGRGPGNKRSLQVPDLANRFLKRGRAFHVGKGLTYWSNVHIHDLGDLYLLLAEAAAKGLSHPEKKDTRPLWDGNGYYFAENGEHVWGKTSAGLAKTATKLGLIEKDEVDSLAAAEANSLRSHGAMIWGANSRSRASRAREFLGWKPVAPSLEETYEEVLKLEARALGVTKGHAVEAAGDA